MDSIVIKDLTYQYPTAEVPTLKSVSLTVKKGELCAIVGANGSGKTTLCNAIRGFVPIFYKGDISGEVLVNGKNVQEEELGTTAMDVGFVFQNPFTQISGVAPTVFDELAYGLCNMGIEPDEIRKRVEEIMKLTKTEEFRDMLVRRTGLPVVLWDERLTTIEANEILIESGVRREDRKKVIDKIAATLILQSYLGSLK